MHTIPKLMKYINDQPVPFLGEHINIELVNKFISKDEKYWITGIDIYKYYTLVMIQDSNHWLNSERFKDV